MSFHWRLAANVFAAAVEDRCVFLDLRKDAYSSISLRSLDQLGDDGKVALALQRNGLVESVETHGDARLALTTWPNLIGATGCRWASSLHALGDLARAFRAGAWTSRMLREPLLQTVEYVRRTPRGASLNGLAREVERFQGARAWFPRDELCLFDSLMLWRWLQHQRLGANWVFGVRLRPFLAHCWLEQDGIALNEELEHVCRFTPILAI